MNAFMKSAAIYMCLFSLMCWSILCGFIWVPWSLADAGVRYSGPRTFEVSEGRKILFVKEKEAKTNELRLKDGSIRRSVLNVNSLILIEKGKTNETIWTDYGHLARIDRRTISQVILQDKRCGFLLVDLPVVELIVAERKPDGNWSTVARGFVLKAGEDIRSGFLESHLRSVNSAIVRYRNAPSEILTLQDDGRIVRTKE